MKAALDCWFITEVSTDYCVLLLVFEWSFRGLYQMMQGVDIVSLSTWSKGRGGDSRKGTRNQNGITV